MTSFQNHLTIRKYEDVRMTQIMQWLNLHPYPVRIAVNGVEDRKLPYQLDNGQDIHRLRVILEDAEEDCNKTRQRMLDDEIDEQFANGTKPNHLRAWRF